MITKEDILKLLPFEEPFLFVDSISELSETGVTGYFRFREDLEFYRGHFKGNPVTPGVILTECCAQIGLVCLGIFLIADNASAPTDGLAMSSSEMEFYRPVYPGETVEVRSRKIYFRFGKLKCEVSMYNSRNELVCKGQLAGMTHMKNGG